MLKRNIDLLPVSLWGPPGSGKTWLYDAFLARVREMSLLEAASLELSILENGKTMPPAFPKPRSPTETQIDHVLLFTRRSRLAKPSGYINRHAHHLRLTDYPGQVTMDILDSPGSDPKADVALDESSLVIAALDHTLLRKTAPRKRSTQKKSKGYMEKVTLDEYTRQLWMLFDRLTTTSANAQPRWISICITKADKLDDPSMDPWDTIQEKFGSQMVSVIHEFQKHPSLKLRLFSVSAAGFIDGTEFEPNFSRGNIKDKAKWSPWNIEKPFFWVLDEREQERIRQNGNRLPRRFFYWLRKQRYISYPGVRS